MPIDLYPNIAKIKRGGVYQNLPGFAQQSADNDIEAMLANKETSSTAQFNHLKNSFFILNGVIYQADIDIKVNDIIAVGTNCHVAVLGDNITYLENLTEDINNKMNDISEESFEEIALTVTNKFMQINGVLATGAYSASIEVEEGEKFKFKCKAGSSVRPYVFISSENVIEYYEISEEWDTVHNYDVEYIVPSDGILYVNSIRFNYIGVRKILETVTKTQKDVNTNSKARINVMQLNKSRNLFNGEYLMGYRANATVVSSDTYCYSKPILLKAGTYLYTTSYATFGGGGTSIYIVAEGGGIWNVTNVIATEVVATITEYLKYSDRKIGKFTLSEDNYVSFNIGRPTSNVPTADIVDNFMIVEGSTIDDFGHYESYFEPYYSIKDSELNNLSGLNGKVAIFDGDSIGRGDSAVPYEDNYTWGYAGRIGKANNMVWKNYSIGGGVITSASNPSLTSRHSVVDNIDTLYQQFPDADYIIFEGGTNDADLIGNAVSDPTVMGTYSETDFSGSYDTQTFTGALETIFYKATQYWKGKHIGFIVAQKMGTADSGVANRRAYFSRAIDICKKWGIPYIDLWTYCYLNPKNPNCFKSGSTIQENVEEGYLYIDGQHLSNKGYDYISPIIEDWMKSI